MNPGAPHNFAYGTADELDALADLEGICNQCRKVPATVYAMDRDPGGWGGRYCIPCADALNFMVTDLLTS